LRTDENRVTAIEITDDSSKNITMIRVDYDFDEAIDVIDKTIVNIYVNEIVFCLSLSLSSICLIQYKTKSPSCSLLHLLSIWSLNPYVS
jgi:hypothetical protein